MRKNEENMTWMDIPYITLTFCLRFYQRVAVPENKVSALRGGLGRCCSGKTVLRTGTVKRAGFRTTAWSGMLFTHRCG